MLSELCTSLVQILYGDSVLLSIVIAPEMTMDVFSNNEKKGRSLLSEELCGDFAREFKKFDRRTWDEDHPSLTSSGMTNNSSNNDDKSEFRSTIQGFVANCRRRDLYEKEIRVEGGLGDDVYVSIPPPGVPSDIAVSLDDLLEEEAGYKAVGVNRDDYFDTPFDVGSEERD